MKDKNTFIFIPNSLDKIKSGCLEGFYKEYDDCEAYYVTNEEILSKVSQRIGFANKNIKPNKYKNENLIHFDTATKTVSIINEQSSSLSLVYVTYDYKAFKQSKVIQDDLEKYGKHFKFLNDHLKKNGAKNGKKSLITKVLLYILILLDFFIKVCNRGDLLKYSATFSHFTESIYNFKWFLKSCAEKDFSPKLGNAIVAKMVDLIIGIVLFYYLIENEQFILSLIERAAENILYSLRELLTFLMGAPIGLKLNHAFNKSLGKFFFYHITLWKIFIHGLQPILENYFHFLVLPGVFGFSFQIAMVSDIISLATFHVYCIYVYAARLFQLQIGGLTSLWRLFIGRKFNPLRQRVDSCEYSPDQLFIGTLGFTVLLFLLPTTTMYYTVFTTFRLVIMALEAILRKIRYILVHLPVYILLLWISSSSNVAGTIYLHWKKTNDEKVNLEARLNTLPLYECIKKFKAFDFIDKDTNSLGLIFHNIITGLKI